ncbi:hypothetical protein FOC4_g10003998 [Fusarium odoratissimum]|uniref:Fungal N-terminal domain-containing protein n=1 Tax=Fusarium oxysporum f. sp. cubense (strain race 4) TaxID=2502994 RepID=N1S6G6_FUSC4|nr:hypothetical protein FOC4_g10003998 [Fusarium odoratissimum]
MDPISAVAIAASLFSFSTSSLLLVQNFVKSGETVRRLNLEVVILQHILQECGETLSNVEPLPHSIRTCAEICIERQRELLYILDRLIHPRRHEWFRYARITLKEPELMVTYNSFRDSVLLLRDLSSTLRMDQQFLHMSLAMAQIISENDDNSFTGYRDGSYAPIAGPMTKALELPDDTRPVKQHVDRRVAFVSEVQELIANDFTRSLVLVVPNGAESFRFVTVRNKIDTGSDENFVNAELLQRHEIDPTTITTIPEETREERTLHMLNDFKFTPTQEIRLSWHKPNDMKQRESDFVIVKDAPFDVLIGSKQWQSEVKKSAFFLIGRHKSKAEKKEQKENAEKEEEDAERLLKAQLEQTEELLKGRTRVNSDKSDEGSKSGQDKLFTIPLSSPSSPGATPPFLASPSVNDSKPTLKHTKLCHRRYLLCFIWLSAVLIYIAIEWFNIVSSADIMKLLAWKHRYDYVLSLHFKFSQVFLQYYFKVLKLKASSSTTPGNGYWGTSDMG